MKRKSLAILLVIALILPTILLTVPQVSATVSGVTHTVSPDSGPVGTHVTSTGLVYGTGDMSGRTVKIYWEEYGLLTALLAETTTESDGSFEAEWNVPADVYGEHAVFAQDVASGKYSQDTFCIEPDMQLCPNCGTYCTDVTLTGTGWRGDDHIHWSTGGLNTDPSPNTVPTSPTGSWAVEFHVEVDTPGIYTFHAWQHDGETLHAYADFIYGPYIELDPNHGQPCEWIDIVGDLPGLEIGTTVYIYLEIPEELECILGDRILIGTATTSAPCGYFEGEFHVPEVPTGEYLVNATDGATVWAAAWFYVVPCIHIDPTSGVVDDTITVYGSGYASNSEVMVWMSGLLPTGVPLEAIVSFYGLVNFVWAWDETNTWLILTVGFFLPVATAETDCYGNFEVSFEIPECWGGYHPIVATDDEGNANIIGGWEDFYDCPVFPDGLLLLERCALVVNKPGILRVLPKIWTDPDSGVSGQTITLYGQGLSAFEFYVWFTDINHNKCPDIFEFCEGEIYVYKRCSGFVLDFGPNKRWIDGPYFPYMFLEYGTGHFILNGQFDGAWSRQSWPGPPWERYSPLTLNPRGTIVSDGMSFTITLDVDYFKDIDPWWKRWVFNFTFAWEYRQVGSPFLTVPWLQPQCCELVAYRFDYIEIEFQAQWPPSSDVLDLSLEFFTYDYDETATTWFEIEPLQVDAGVDVESVLSRLDELEAQITGLVETAEGNILARIETAEGNIVADLSALDAKIVALSGTVATIETAVGTIEADLSALDAKIVALSGDVATIGAAIGEIDVALDDLNAYVTVDLAARLATIETDLGTLEGKLVTMEGNMATIETDVGTITDKADLIVNHTGSMPVTIALSLIAAIAAIAAAVLILRKVYIA